MFFSAASSLERSSLPDAERTIKKYFSIRLQDAVNGHGAVVEVAEDFDFVIDVGHGNCIQNGLVNVGTGDGITLGVLVGIDQVERGEIVVSAFLTGAGLAFTNTDYFGLNSHFCFLLDLNIDKGL